MVLDRLDVTTEEFERATGWKLEARGACQDDVCVPLPPLDVDGNGRFDAAMVAEHLGMPIAHDDAHNLWAIGPRSGDRRVLDRARLPDLSLSDFDGNPFDMMSLRGRKVVLVAWSSW
jgi:hypothetical protein